MAVKSVAYGGITYDISYELKNTTCKKDMAVLHGWGSNKELMRGALEGILSEYRHIYIDMPGFGASSNPSVLTTHEYALILKEFLDALNFSGDIVLGHSFGGKVATLLNPELLVLVASSGILLPKPLSVKIKISLFKLLKACGLQRFRALFVAEDAATLSPHMYETFKQVVNEDFSSSFAAFKGKTLLCFAHSDTATPLYTAYAIEGLMDDARVAEFEGDHYFFMSASHRLEQEIQNSLKELEQ